MVARVDLAAVEAEIRYADLEALEAFKSGRARAPMLYKAMGYSKDDDKAAGQGAGSMIFVASEESPDRMGDVIEAAGWQLTEFKRNPVLLWHHDHTIAPIGTVPKVWMEGKQLLNTVKWDEEDPLGLFLMGKYNRRIMRAESVGFRPLEFEDADHGDGRRFTKQELIEISAVAVPMHPHALQKMLDGRRFRVVVPELMHIEQPVPDSLTRGPLSWAQSHPQGTSKADRNALWDDGKERVTADIEDLRVMAAWVDSDAPDNKGSYKLLHHKAGTGHPVVFRALVASIVVLNGGRGGVDIPEQDRGGVYRHIAKHYKDDFETDAPSLKSAADIEAEDALLEGKLAHRLVQGTVVLSTSVQPAIIATGVLPIGNDLPSPAGNQPKEMPIEDRPSWVEELLVAMRAVTNKEG